MAALGDPVNAVDHSRSGVQLLGASPDPPDSDLELSAALIEARMDLAKVYSLASAAAATPKRAEFQREAQLAATASLQMAQAIIAKRPELAGDYAAFIAKDKELLTRH